MVEQRKKSAARWKRLLGMAAGLGLAAAGAAWLPAPSDPVHIHGEVLIARPPQAVFDFVTTPANWPRWHPSSIAVSGATDHPLQLGEAVSEDFVVAGRRGRVRWTVTQADAPSRWRIEGRGEGGGEAWIAYTLSGQDGATRFERDMRYRMPNLLAALLDPLLTRPRIAAESAQALQRLEDVLEGEVTPM